MKLHCCNEERGCHAFDCDSEEADCSCGCLRCDNTSSDPGEDEVEEDDDG